MKYLFLLFSPFFLSAQIYTYDSLYEKILTNSHLIKSEKIKYQLSQVELNLIEANDYPTLSMGFSIENSKTLNKNILSSSVNGSTISTATAKKAYSSLNLNYNIYDFGKNKNKEKAQENIIFQKKNKVCYEANEIAYKLLKFYSEVHKRQNQNNVLIKILNHYKNIYQYQKKLFKAGEAEQNNIIEYSLKIVDLDFKINNNKKETLFYLHEIEKLLNINFKKNETIIFSSLYSDDTLSHIENNEFSKTFYGKMLHSIIKEKMFLVTSKKREYFPSFDFYGVYDFYGEDKDSYSEAFNELTENSYRMGISLKINIFDGFRTQSNIEKAILELQLAENQYVLKENEFNVNLNQNKEKIHAALIDLKKSKEQNKNSLLIYKNTSSLNQLGERSQIEVLNKEIEHFYSQVNYIEKESTFMYEKKYQELLTKEHSTCNHL